MARRGAGWVWPTINAALPILGSFGAAQLLSWGLRDTTGNSGWLYTAAGTSLAMAVSITIAGKIVEHRRGVTADGAKRGLLLKLRDEYMKWASTTADMARQPHEQRHAYLSQVADSAATALRSVVSDHVNRPRAVVYMLNTDEDPFRMQPVGRSGRGEKPNPFVAGTPRGDAALAFIEKRATSHYPDLENPKKPKPDGYVGTMSGYKTFIAAPIWTDTGVYGMVTLDAPRANSFDDGDVALVELTAEMMAIAFEIGQDDNAPDPRQIGG
ncbi:GAF domain-containing protein [Microbacterium sp. AG790]|uniref:GAF domain-containing protein n=1 Tax=Microbacterium sp. AG790 TaxID=2183995 RepID=UPI001C7DE69E|nr:GAF domain-containing protein [Microbacterium sp. AG790]